jgi:hypothetical protein
MWTACLIALLAASNSPEIVAAGHHGVASASQIRWRSAIVIADRAPPPAVLLKLARPLEPNVHLEGARAIRDERGAIIALAWDGEEIVTSQEIAPGEVTLSPPIFSGNEVQRITVEGLGRFTPSEELGLEPHVDHWSSPEIEPSDRAEVNGLLSHRLGPAGPRPIFVRGSDRFLSTTGLRGLITAKPVTRLAPWVAALAFLGVVMALVLLWRGLAHRVRSERAEAEMNAEFDRIS